MWKLVIEDDEGKRTIVPLTRDEYSIGRKEGNTIRLTERNVSRDHAKVARHVDDTGKSVYAIEDLTSYNGIFVNGLRVAHAQDLVHGDLIQIGDYRVVLQDDALTEGVSSSSTGARTSISDGGGRASQLMEKPNRLVMLAGPTPAAEYALDAERITIGRADDAGIAVNHNSVSRLHCEVHALGDGRFEIVDKGSANGVRVNGADLRRGIIEAGDVIELGDVRFRFVGAGQIFLPGATDSQRLAAISDRTATSILGARRTSNALPVSIFFAVVSVGAAIVWHVTRPQAEVASSVQSAVPSASPGQAVVEEAKRLCASGDCGAAHDKLAGGLAADSPLRDVPEVRSIEARWADELLSRASQETDPAKRRDLFERVASSSVVDLARRKQAGDALLADDSSPSRAVEPAQTTARTGAIALPSGEPLKKHATALAPNPEGPQTFAATPPVSVGTLPAVVPPAPKAVSIETDFEKERGLALQNSDSKRIVKAQLEAKMQSGRASDDELRLLKNVCKDLGERACSEQARAALIKRSQ